MVSYIESLKEYIPIDQISIRIYHWSSADWIKNSKDDIDYYIYQFKTNIFFDKNKLYYNYQLIKYCKVVECENYDILNQFTFKLKKKKENGFLYLNASFNLDVAADTIKRAWKKNKWNYLRNLAAWKYHPSRLTFEID